MISFGTQLPTRCAVCKATLKSIYGYLYSFFADNILFICQGALEKTKKLDEGIAEIHNLTKQLALYFCEDEGKLKLQELLSLFKTFCDQLVKAKKVIIDVELKELYVISKKWFDALELELELVFRGTRFFPPSQNVRR